jgi:DNA-binding response OmpR family regulator
VESIEVSADDISADPWTVVICEDDEDFLRILQEKVFTATHGFQVEFTFSSAIEFLSAIPIVSSKTSDEVARFLPDLLVIDVMPPGVSRSIYSMPDGVSVMTHVRSVGVTCPILVMSSLSEVTLAELVMESRLKNISYIRKSATLTLRSIRDAAMRLLINAQ